MPKEYGPIISWVRSRTPKQALWLFAAQEVAISVPATVFLMKYPVTATAVLVATKPLRYAWRGLVTLHLEPNFRKVKSYQKVRIKYLGCKRKVLQTYRRNIHLVHVPQIM